jgi:hypothetical protein
MATLHLKVWKEFDADCSGFIEADELKDFIRQLLKNRKGICISEDKLVEYADTVVSELYKDFRRLLTIIDVNFKLLYTTEARVSDSKEILQST